MLEELVTRLVNDTWRAGDPTIADRVLGDDAFGALVGSLDPEGDGDEKSVRAAFGELTEALTDRDLDFLEVRATNPAAFLVRRLREAV